jgi:hypothetical protein
MISKKARKYLDKNIQDAADWVDKDGIGRRVILEYDAIKAIELAEQEIKDKAVYAFEEFVGRYCRDNNIHYICDDSEHYINAFKGLLNK